MGLIRRLFAYEDLVWGLWLIVLAPAKDQLFLDGGRATVFLLIAGLGFWLAALVGERGDARRPESYVLFLSLALCAIFIDVALQQLGAEFPWRQVNTLVAVLFGILLAVQHQRAGGRAWVSVPRWLRRALGWPFLMVLADFFGGLIGAMSKPSLASTDDTLGATLFTYGLTLLVIMPMIYAFMVIAPRLLLFADVEPRSEVWVSRYLWAVAAAWIGTAIVGPLLDG